MSRPTGLDCFIYLRKSRKDVEEEKKALSEGHTFDTLDRHRNLLLELAKKEGHSVIEIFEEVVSGEYIYDRPEIQRMLREIENGVVDAVLVMDLDRLGRGDMFDMGYIYRTLKFSETLVITPTEIVDPQEDGAELYFGVKSILSREELKGITKRLQRGRRISAREGRSITKKPPFGYIRNENLKLCPDPETAWIVQLIFEKMANGSGRYTIARELSRMGIKTPDGKEQWCNSTITAILKNEVYLGHIVWGKERYIKRNGKYIKKKVPPEQWERCNDAHEPLVSDELFNKANSEHSKRRRPPTSKDKQGLANPLAGILECELCGYALRRFPYKNRRPQVRCVSVSCEGIQKGAVFELVEEKILKGLEQIISTFEVSDVHSNNENSSSFIKFKKAQLIKLKQVLYELQAKENYQHELLEAKQYTFETFMKRQKIVKDQISKTQNQIEALEEEIELEIQKEKRKNEFIPKVKNVLSTYRETDDVYKKNRLLKSVLEKATYLRKKEWKKADEFKVELFPRI